MPRPVHVIGVSLDLGGNRRGVDMGPSAFRIAGLGERLAGLGMPVVDAGDLVAPIPETKNEGDPAKKYVREIARVWTGSAYGFRPNIPFAWGAQPHKDMIFFNDMNSGLWIVKLGKSKDKGSTTTPGN